MHKNQQQTRREFIWKIRFTANSFTAVRLLWFRSHNGAVALAGFFGLQHVAQAPELLVLGPGVEEELMKSVTVVMPVDFRSRALRLAGGGRFVL